MSTKLKASPPAGTVESLLRELLAGQQVIALKLERLAQSLEPRRPRAAHDPRDADLLLALVHSAQGRSFSAADVVERAHLVDPSLKAALLAADVVTVPDLATWLGRMHREPTPGFTLDRGRRDRGGRLWTLRVV